MSKKRSDDYPWRDSSMLPKKRILILDDESTLRSALFRAFDRKGYSVITANKIEEAAIFLHTDTSIDLAIIDINLPDGDGVQFIDTIRNTHPKCEFIILTGHATIDSAIKATQKGVIHYLTKPFNLEELIQNVETALNKNLETNQSPSEKKSLSYQIQNLNFEEPKSLEKPKKNIKFSNIIGESDEIRSVLNLIYKIAESDSTVLVSGESGTGKELIAKAIHMQSSRSSGPFIAINCGAIPSELLESELFGHVKGAFTGAIQNRIGRFELADGGTIFLDEIGDLDPSLQVKLLRVLQERQFEPVGGTKTIQVNVRVVAATNVNLEEAVEKNQFREDLYYRLNVIPIQIPPLRERKSDIPILLNHFIHQFSRGRSKILTGISTEALECLLQYPWPGNIRELENLVERLTILKGEGRVEIVDLPTKYKNQKNLQSLNSVHIELSDDGMDFNAAVDAFENSLILKALEKTNWNRNQAAQLLRLNRTTLVEKLKKKGLKPQEGILTSTPVHSLDFENEL